MLARFFLLLLLSTSVAFASDTKLTAVQILGKMQQAMASLNYQGTVIFSKNGKIEPMKYFHIVNKGVEQEYLQSLNSPLREIIRNRDEVIFMFKDHFESVVINNRNFEHSFLADMPSDINELTPIYKFDVAGKETVALLPAYVIAMQPKDDFRYLRKIWVDSKNFLPLKLAVYGATGELLEEIFFTDVEIKASLPFKDVREILASTKPPTTIHLNEASFAVSNLPLGFKKVFFSLSPLHKEQKLVEHLLLSDGFASVSVYVENIGSTTDSSLLGLHAMGSINSFSKILNVYLITVMGEVPAKTVQQIAEAITLQAPKQ